MACLLGGLALDCGPAFALPPAFADAWDGLAFDAAAFAEVVELAEGQHLVGELPSRAWVAAATGALRELRPKVSLFPATFVRQERLSAAGRERFNGELRPLSCPGRANTGLLLHIEKAGKRASIANVAALRAMRKAKGAFNGRHAAAWQQVAFDRQDFDCVMGLVQARIAAAAVGLPDDATATLARKHTAWRLSASFFLRGLDPHCDVIPNRLFERLEKQASGFKLVDVGITFIIDGAKIVIRRIHPRGPAAGQKIRAGDRLLAVGKESVAGLDLDAVDKLIAGKIGTKVRLRLRRDRKKPRNFTLTRAEVHRSTVSGHLAPSAGKVAVLRLPQFADKAGAEVAEEIAQLQMEARAPLEALVIDMRGNTGGWVDEAAAVADLLLSGGKIATVRSRRAPDKVYSAEAQATDLKLPVVLLTDGGCRSSCELVAAALRENGRALVVGAPTWGKGSVQGVYDARQGPWAVLLTIALYLGPNGRSLQARGVDPDVPVASLIKAQAAQRREADLSTHLTSEDTIGRTPNPLHTPQLKACAQAARRAAIKATVKGRHRDRALQIAVEHAHCMAQLAAPEAGAH